MKPLQYVVAFIQVTLILVWTAVSALVGIVLMLVTFNGQWVHYFEGRYFFSPVILFLARVQLKVTGLENLDLEKPSIYVSNHVSHLDVVCIAKAIPIGLFYIAKKELKSVPFLGQYMTLIGHIFIDRKNREQAMISMRKAAQLINDGKSVITFPEGTRSSDGRLSLFKKGTFVIAKEGAIDIQPIAVLNADKILPRDSFIIHSGTIEVRIGKRIHAHEFAGLNTEEAASLSRERVLQLLQQP
ncbi:MAG: lysophospholipid acyltransferase family protein [Flavobacteriales bacterium]